MFENQPKGLYALALANTGERFGYYTMLAIFVLFLQANFGWGEGLAGTVYSTFLMLVYFLPIAGGAVADKIGFGRCVTFGWCRSCCYCDDGSRFIDDLCRDITLQRQFTGNGWKAI